ncbi:hypothetical protein BDF22DRAFT_674039 [Syncephalis plumigaleata]|nr:hypothetical protein BDF22DRAFT_674039 [Syncephalis plumigaleata]
MFCHLGQLIPAKCRKQYARIKRICRRKKGKSVHGTTQSQLSRRTKRRDTGLSSLTNCQFCLEAISGVFPSLPRELILQISSWLDPASALALSRTSKKLREIIINDNVAWRRRYEEAYPPTNHREREFLAKLRRNKYVTAITRLGFRKSDDNWLEAMARRASTEHHWRTDTGVINVTSLQPLTISANRRNGKQSLEQNDNETVNNNKHNMKRLFRNSQQSNDTILNRLSVESLFPSSLWLHAAVEFTVALYNGRLYVRYRHTRTWRRLLPVIPVEITGNPLITRPGDALIELDQISIEGVKVHGRYVRGLGCLDTGEYWDFFWDALFDISATSTENEHAPKSNAVPHQYSFAAFREGVMEIVDDKLLLQDFGTTSSLAIYDLRAMANGDTSDPCIPPSPLPGWLQGDQAPLASYVSSESLPGYLLAVKLHTTATVLRCFSLDLNYWADLQQFMVAVDIPMYANGPCSWVELAAGGFNKKCAIVHGHRSSLSGDHSFLMGLNPTLGRCNWYTEITQLEIAAVRVALDHRRITLLSSESQLLIHDLATGQPLHCLSLQVPRGPRLDRLDHILGPLLLISDHAVSTEDPSGQTIVLVDVTQGRELWRRRIQRTETMGSNLKTSITTTTTTTTTPAIINQHQHQHQYPSQRVSFISTNPPAIPPRLTVCATHMLVATLSRRTIIELVFTGK